MGDKPYGAMKVKEYLYSKVCYLYMVTTPPGNAVAKGLSNRFLFH
jgi:hypothetical protein